MGVTIKSTNNIPKLIEQLEKLEKKEIKVGVFGHDSNVDNESINIVTLARVHEFGMTIRPKHSKYLSIPSSKKSKGKSPRDFNNLFFIPTSNGNGLLARDKKKRIDKGTNNIYSEIEVLFVLVKSVTIPERSFLRTGFDKNLNKILRSIKKHINDVIELKVNPEIFADIIGKEFAGYIQQHLIKLQDPPDAAITVATKGSSNPLVDTGRLVGSIRSKVE